MKTPREKYYSDLSYKRLVDVFINQIINCYYTPSELREAALLASIMYEEKNTRPYIMTVESGVTFNRFK